MAGVPHHGQPHRPSRRRTPSGTARVNQPASARFVRAMETQIHLALLTKDRHRRSRNVPSNGGGIAEETRGIWPSGLVAFFDGLCRGYPIRKLVDGAAATVTGALDVAWTESALYVAVRVEDATRTPGREGEALMGDNVMVGVDGLNNREAIYNADDLFLALPRGAPGLICAKTIGNPLRLSAEQRELEHGYFAVFRINSRAAWYCCLPPIKSSGWT